MYRAVVWFNAVVKNNSIPYITSVKLMACRPNLDLLNILASPKGNVLSVKWILLWKVQQRNIFNCLFMGSLLVPKSNKWIFSETCFFN